MNRASTETQSRGHPVSMIQIGECSIDLRVRTLRRSGNVVQIGARAFDVLATIALAGGRIVSNEDIMRAAWPDTIVEENNIHVQVSAIRKALGPEEASY